MQWSVLAYLQQHWVTFALFGGYLVGGYVASMLVRAVVRRVLGRITAHSRTTLDDRILAIAVGPAGNVIWLGGFYLALEALRDLPGLADSTAMLWAFRLLFALAVIVVTLVVNHLLQSLMDWYLHEVADRTQAVWDREILPVLRRVLLVVLFFISGTIILERLGVPVTALVTTAGVTSLAFALAAQDTLANMIAGFTILVDRPFRVGDVVELTDGKAGEVLEIGLRTTKIRLFDGNALVIPNKDVAGSHLTNFALPNAQRAVRQTIGVSYGSDLELVRDVLVQTMQDHPEVLKDPEPGVYFTNFADSALEVLIVCWVDDYRNWFRVKDELLMEIWRRFKAEGIEVPFPQRDVHLYTHTAIVGDGAAPRADGAALKADAAPPPAAGQQEQ